MRIYLLSAIALIALVNSATGQITYDLKTAKALALEQRKLIIVDFWATWCKPCRTMDDKLWHSTEFSKLTDRFVLLKIDIDSNRGMAAKYHVKAIPRVYIITANEDRLWDEQGFGGAGPYLNTFSSFPKDYTELNRSLLQLFNKKEVTPEHLFDIAQEFQELGLKTANTRIKAAFLSLSDAYFKKVRKNTDSEALDVRSALSQILNYAYRGSHKKAMKKLDKLAVKEDLAHVKEFKDFVLAYCYKCEGDLKKLEELKKQIKDKELLARLD